MEQMDFRFVDGQVLPGFIYPIDGVFPNLYGVQMMSGGTFRFQRGDGPPVEYESPVFFWNDVTTTYRYGPGASGYWDHHWLTFTGGLAVSYYQPILEALAPLGHLPLANADTVVPVFRDLIESVHRSDTSFYGQIHRLNHFLSLIDRGRSGPSAPADGILKVRERIEASPGEVFDFRTLARSCGCSYSTFRRTFRQRYGMAPGAYLSLQRMRRAALELARSDRNVQEIGYSLGFEDPSQFSRAFRRHHGFSPRDYRTNVTKFAGGAS